MTSGQFQTVPLSSITVGPDRVRKEFKQEDIDVLADSISRLGLIHPPVITREYVLAAGERRIRALGSLGWTNIPVQFIDTLDPAELLALELEENVKRKDLTWQEQCNSLLRLHELKLSTEENWDQSKTAACVGLTPAAVSQQLSVAKELAAGNEKIASTKEYTVARGLVVRQAARKAADESALISAAIDEEFGYAGPVETPILTADFLQWAPDYRGAPFNFIHCDFPYGINADKFNQSAAETLGGYVDTPEHYWNLVETLCKYKVQLLGESGHILFWFSMRHYEATLRALSAHFWVDPYPVVWWKTDNRGTLPDPTRGPRRVYEVAFVCSHGDRKIIQSVANTFGAPTTRVSDHMSEKNEDMLKHFFRMFVDGDTRILDPTAGSGSSLRAARSMGARHLVGLELNPDFAEAARIAWRQAQGSLL